MEGREVGCTENPGDILEEGQSRRHIVQDSHCSAADGGGGGDGHGGGDVLDVYLSKRVEALLRSCMIEE
ncbi:hypothetical protein SERLADRAFT_467062 [Serpula lacrymans var. lacrymans S7.9]|uniref:Uncharacterized protein n=1 Tax=Serpula lacrymans var. lacrymans (strain S7.9) TaxID=578457 RepID=F8NXX9_SERL9|nr:uncharacterized protein SERLADRAFT_467062 [Serpula lacrymans var. lacrymans S7.9]EGO24171.1 hypothetical protein SERLADRAFT_467062 [Serpula lacrymans var. lacrymans S7.9]